mgnify:CR=1 FL=1
MPEIFFDPQTYLSFLLLTSLEIVLGVDNILFISIVVSRLPKHKRKLARRLGLFMALFGRIALLFSLNFVMSLTKPLIQILDFSFSGRDLVLGLGGLFLLYKATQEIFFHLEEAKNMQEEVVKTISMTQAILQILVLDLVFSLDSIITALGLVKHVNIMVVAIIIAVLIMLFFAELISNFLDAHPSMKVLGLAFLLLVGVLLVAEAFGHHVPKGYVYFALAFSLCVEIINIKYKKNTQK